MKTTTQPLTEEQKSWIEEHIYLFTTPSGASRPQKEEVYRIYNHLYLQNKKATGCGRCWTQTKTLVYHEYLKQTN